MGKHEKFAEYQKSYGRFRFVEMGIKVISQSGKSVYMHNIS